MSTMVSASEIFFAALRMAVSVSTLYSASAGCLLRSSWLNCLWTDETSSARAACTVQQTHHLHAGVNTS